MKIFAIASVPATLQPEQLQAHMPAEVYATIKHYLDGKIEQFWFRDKAGPIFLMDAESIDAARAELATLPLVAAGLMKYELLPVMPLMPLGRLLPAA
ncbi:MAG TPA: hypothetical protein VGN46_04400 [Luteibacter sp.]|jgi:hypothetical protein|uniref:hypothetical protein n=1 Tax=Luteibacter sp. TaxID=1886636 RepID=UPI002F3FD6DA